MEEFLINLDFGLFKILNAHWPGGDQIMWAVSGTWWWAPLYILLLWEIWKASTKEWDRMLVRVLLLALCVAGTDVISARVIKPAVQRFRPSHSIELKGDVNLVVPPGRTEPYIGGRFGFVSSHAANCTGVAVFVGLILGGGSWLWILLGWSLLVGYSRIYLGVHFPLDILGGSILGGFIGYLLWRVQHKMVGNPVNAS